MRSKFKIITLCGDAADKEAMENAARHLSGEGFVVLSAAISDQVGEKRLPERDPEDQKDPYGWAIDVITKSKIDMSREIYVVNVGGRIAPETQAQIDYARSRRKQIRYLVPIK